MHYLDALTGRRRGGAGRAANDLTRTAGHATRTIMQARNGRGAWLRTAPPAARIRRPVAAMHGSRRLGQSKGPARETCRSTAQGFNWSTTVVAIRTSTAPQQVQPRQPSANRASAETLSNCGIEPHRAVSFDHGGRARHAVTVEPGSGDELHDLR